MQIGKLLKSREEVLKFVQDMKPHDHVILIYEGPQEKYDILFTYIVSGIEKGYAGAYVAGEEPVEQIRKRMKEYGIDVERLEREKALLIINYDGWYIKDGKMDPSYTINLWIDLLEEAMKRGYRSLRATGEMSCFFRHKQVEKLLEYERTLHRRLELAMMGLCAYNGKDFLGGLESVLIQLIASHSHLIVAGPGLTLVKVEERRASDSPLTLFCRFSYTKHRTYLILVIGCFGL